MPRKIVIHFLCMRHGHPNDSGTDLDDLGRQQINASREMYFTNIRFRFAATSNMQQAEASLAAALAASDDINRYSNPKFDDAWLCHDSRLPQWSTPSITPTNALELIRDWAPAMLLGHTMWERLMKLSQYEFFMVFYARPATFADEDDRVVEGNALVVGHGGIIEAMAAVAANQAIPLAEVPILGHADVLRFTVEWTDDEWGILEPHIVAIEHLPCPVKAPKE